MSEYIVQGSTLTAIASAIREKAGTSLSYRPSEMASAILNLPSGGGGDTTFDTYYYSSDISAINELPFLFTSASDYSGQYCLKRYPAKQALLSTDLSNNSRILGGKFSLCTTIGQYAFGLCSMLKHVDFPICSSIGSYAFVGIASGMTINSISFPLCEYIGNYAFSGCNMLEHVDFPECTSVGGSAFQDCLSLKSVSFPKCSSIGSYAFAGYASAMAIETISFPLCEYIGNYAFKSCIKLLTVDLPVCQTISDYAFSECTGLKSIYLGFSSICSIGYSTFKYTPMVDSGYLGYFGSIFVPSSLYNAYILLSPTVLSERFVSI